MSSFNPIKTPYPATRRDESFVEKFTSAQKNGDVLVPDPYHYLSDPEAEETKKFVADQSAFTRQYLDLQPSAQQFKDALTKNWNYARFSCPALKGDGNYYFTYNSGLQPQDAIYRFPRGQEVVPVKEGEVGGELFFDPSLLSTDGSVSRSSSAFSKDGKWFAYALSRSGSDWTTIYIRSTDHPHVVGQVAGTDDPNRLDEVIRFCKFSGIGWTADSKGFFYQRFAEKKEHGTDSDDKAGTETDSDINAMVYYHRVGTPQSQDVLVHKDAANPHWMFGAGGTTDGRYVTMSISKDTGKSNLLWVADLEECEIGPNMIWHKIVDEWGTLYSDVANDKSLFYIYTNKDDSPNYKLVTYDLEHPEKGFTDLVPHNPDALLSSLHIANDNALLLQYSVDVKDSLYLHDLETGSRISELAQGLVGSIGQISGRREDKEYFFSTTSFTTPGTVYRYSFEADKGKEETLYRATTVSGIEPSEFVTEQVFYPSKDGTKIPMFITRLAGLENDGTAPAILYGYGGFDISLDPFFSPSFMTWVKHYRGVFAVANLRGGGEYGEDWHQGGTKEKKQNVFDDFQCAAKFLSEKGYAAKDKVAISGGSNGGLLVAACANQAPELFGACIADVGVMDMLRFHRYTIGRAWTADYGSSDNPVDFDYLFKFSPLHNVDSTKVYPPMMLLTADHDDRVVPLHSLKLAAELQHKLKDNAHPLLLRVDTKSGHGAGKSTDKKILEAADKFGFVNQSLGLEFFP